MKKIIALIALVAMFAVNSANAGVPITKVDKVAPTDEIFMDMAVTAAKKAVKEGQAPCGAVIILNGAWRSTGTPGATATAEENAISKSRRQTMSNSTLYTIVEPTTEVYNTICKLGADAIYFVVGRDEAVAKGIYPASAYDDSKVDSSVPAVPMSQLPYADAETLVKNYNKK